VAPRAGARCAHQGSVAEQSGILQRRWLADKPARRGVKRNSALVALKT
jgi:hypothetical protein